jgi:AraC-like DNA-binding protein
VIRVCGGKIGPISGTGVRPTVLAAVHDEEWRSHVKASIDACSLLTFVDDVHELSVAAEKGRPDVILWHLSGVIDRTDAHMIAFQEVRRTAPGCVVVAYGQIDRSVAPLLLLAGRIGVDRLLIRGFDDLGRAIREVARATDVEVVIRDTLAQLGVQPGRAASTLAHCLRQTIAGRITVEQLADEFHVNRRTIGAWLREASLPTPEHLIGWCRVYWVARSLSSDHRSIGQITRALGFSSGSDLRRMVARYAGCTPTDLRSIGGLERMMIALRGRRSTGGRTTKPVSRTT